jgi:hypothetical protein
MDKSDEEVQAALEKTKKRMNQLKSFQKKKYWIASIAISAISLGISIAGYLLN